MRALRQNTAVTIPWGPTIASSDGITPTTATTPTPTLTPHGSTALARASTGAVTYDGDGMWRLPLATNDVATLGPMRGQDSGTGIVPVWDDYEVLPQGLWDALYTTALLSVNAQQLAGDSANIDTLLALPSSADIDTALGSSNLAKTTALAGAGSSALHVYFGATHALLASMNVGQIRGSSADAAALATTGDLDALTTTSDLDALATTADLDAALAAYNGLTTADLPIQVNTVYMASVNVVGSGTSADPWRPTT